ncbi:MAG: glycosyltransferase family 2 protein, partial [Bacteroidetes bacterium]
MKNISAIIITYNEEKNIKKCLDSLKGVVDEIVVVDSFSKDKTKEICLEYNVAFYQNPFEGYSQEKNYANSLAKNEYILSLDADEALL